MQLEIFVALFNRVKFHQHTFFISRAIKEVAQGGAGLHTPQAEQRVNQVICGVKYATENVREIHHGVQKIQ